MGCGNDANCFFSRAVFPDSFKLLFLQHLEKFGLKTDGYLGDFVQKERAAVCNLNPSHTILVSTGESAFNMAEEFAFEQLIWDRGAVYLDERPLLSWTARAISSLPVPDSPRIRTVELVPATSCI